MRVTPLLRAAMLAGMALLARPVLAQAPSPAPAPTPPAADAKPQPLSAMGEKRRQMVEGQLKQLHDRLKITPDEQGVWDAFATARRETVRREDTLFQQSPPGGQQTALAMMQAYAKVTQGFADNVQAVLPHFAALYDALTPAQKQAADKIFVEHRAQMMMHVR